jgi:hypothetical protein
VHPNARTAVFLVNGFNGLGLHTLLAVIRMFPRVYQNFVSCRSGVLDAGNFKGAAEVENLREHSRAEVERFVAYMRQRGFYSEAVSGLGTDIVEEAARRLCEVIAKKFRNTTFFAGPARLQGRKPGHPLAAQPHRLRTPAPPLPVRPADAHPADQV